MSLHKPLLRDIPIDEAILHVGALLSSQSFGATLVGSGRHHAKRACTSREHHADERLARARRWTQSTRLLVAAHDTSRATSRDVDGPFW